ncbi:MAG: DUF1549 domain-containing protein [Planctomycetaceae bacterium]|nr:DUF1549 domain-containing protein [Planctomycetaceae bacterium]MBT7728858.1 DUF1549 domain-containing protein [Planctomycetaceae bacterium]
MSTTQISTVCRILLLVLIVATTHAHAENMSYASARIDDIITVDLKKHELQPNPPASDIQFVRRVYLDVIGRIPTSEELQRFFAETSKDRRAKLINQLLKSPGHESHMFNWLGDMLRVKDDYYRIGKTYTFHAWLKSQLRENRPWDEIVYDMLTAEGRLGENGATAYLLRDASMPLDSLSNTLTTFLGANVACAQCHDHPFADWTQRDFYEMASFFGSTDFERVDTRKPAITLRDDRFSKANLVTLLQPNMERVVFNNTRSTVFPEDYAYDDAKPGEKVVPKFITWEGMRRANVTTKNPRHMRTLFATWLTSPKNPRFAEAIANRIWKKFFGIAVMEPMTNLDKLKEATNPQLLEFLGLLMRDVDFDLRKFQRVVLNTKTYQQQASMTPPEGEDFRFPGPLLRRMTAEQTWDSIVLLLRGPEIDRIKTDHAPNIERLVFPFEFENDKKKIVKDREKIFAFAKTLLTEQQSTKDSNSDGGRGLFMSSTKGRKTKLRGEDSWLRASELPQPMPPTHFLQVAGQSTRAIADDGSTEGGIAESLAMMNGEVAKSLMSKASDTDTTVKKTTRKKATRKENRGKRKTMQSVQSGGTKTSQDKGTQAMQITAIYSAMLSRPPRTQDMKQCLNALDQGLGFDDIVWALLNSREFMFIQ